jgi:hypothetical protein
VMKDASLNNELKNFILARVDDNAVIETVTPDIEDCFIALMNNINE